MRKKRQTARPGAGPMALLCLAAVLSGGGTVLLALAVRQVVNAGLAGEGLHIVKLNLDDGVLEAEGRILALEYADEPKMGKKGFLSGLFK